MCFCGFVIHVQINLLSVLTESEEAYTLSTSEPLLAIMEYGRYRNGIGTFEQSYRCYPMSFLEKPNLEKGDKIVMPPSALDRLASLPIEYPMLFELKNPSTEKVTHCGVLEFIADEGLIYLPYWMMQNMLLQEGDLVQLKNTSLAKGTYVKLQPHTKNFLDISNPKAVLETSLRSHSCLTTGDTITIAYNNKQYCIDIVETKPAAAISIIETDCEVDFAPPLDYKEPTKRSQSALSNSKPSEAKEEPAPKMAKFSPFTGSGRRLDGKPAELNAYASSLTLKQQQSEADNAVNCCSSKSAKAASKGQSGKLVFGSNVNSSQQETLNGSVKKESQVPQMVEERKFQAFTGKKYSLKG